MCGIAACAGKDRAEPFLLKALQRLEYRGYDGCGYVVDDNGVWRFRRELIPVSQVQDQNWPGNVGIGHTRWATHGEPSIKNTHPVFGGINPVKAPTVAVVHNGIITNYTEFRSKLQDKHYHFCTDTDTEIIAHLIDWTLGSINKVYDLWDVVNYIGAALKLLEGNFAIAVISSYFPGTIVAMSRGLPLVVSPEGYIASDVAALSGFTERYYRLENMEAIAAKVDTSFIYNTPENRYVIPIWKQVPKVEVVVSPRNFSHNMEREIFEQPNILRDVIDRPRTGTVPKKIFIFGCGSSYNAALLGRHYMEEIACIPTEVEYASELLYRPIHQPEGTLFIGISQSGETADTLLALERMRTRYNTIAIVNSENSTIAQKFDYIPMGAGNEIGVAATKTFTTSCTTLLELAIQLATAQGMHSIIDVKELIHDKLPFYIEQILHSDIQQNALQSIATKCASYSNVLYLARYFNYPIALEGALKLKEIAYIPTDAMPSAEMKHGPIALIDDKSLTIFIITSQKEPKLQPKVIANMREIKARHGYIVAIADASTAGDINIADTYFVIPKVHEWLQPILSNIPLQLLAYYTAVTLGRDVDRPRNLAKSVTVE